MKEFISGDFHLHFIPMNFIKSYFGEKYAFEYSFLLHYQAWLIFPAIFGVLISIFQVFMYLRYEDLDLVFDNKLNAVYSLFLAFWASIFKSSWKYK